MRLPIILLVLLISTTGAAQQVVLTPGPHGQMYPAYVDPQYGIDGRALIPQQQPRPIVVYDQIVPEGRSQRVYQLEPMGNGQWLRTPLVVGDD